MGRYAALNRERPQAAGEVRVDAAADMAGTLVVTEYFAPLSQ